MRLFSLICALFLTVNSVDVRAGCAGVQMEMVFLADGSSSVSQVSFDLMKKWIADFVDKFDISQTATRVSVVQFTDNVSDRNGFGFPLSGQAARVKSDLANLRYMTGNTHAGNALRYVKNNVLSRARKSASKVLIVLTDGVSQDEIEKAASDLIGDKVLVFSVGIGNSVDEYELEKIAGLPEYVFKTANYNALTGITDTLYNKLCSSLKSDNCISSVKQDLSFIVDSSSSITISDYQKLKTWMKSIIEKLEIGENASRVSILQFSGQSARPQGRWINPVLTFDGSTSKEAVIGAIDGMTKLNGDTCIGEALDYFYRNIFTSQAGLRSDVEQRVIVMTDGKRNCPAEIAKPAELIRAQEAEIYAIGIGHQCGYGENHNCYDRQELHEIASKPADKYVFEINNFDQLILKRIGILGDVCEKAECPDIFADIVFVVDSSGSIGPKRFDYMKNWVKSIAASFKVGENFARFSVVQYTKTAKTVVDFKTLDLSSISRKIDSMVYFQGRNGRGGKTFTGNALETAHALLKESETGRKRIVLLLTDGSSDDEYGQVAKAIRDDEVDIFAVGVGRARKTELVEITGDEQRVWQTRTFNNIGQFNQKLLAEVCSASEDACPDQELDLVFMLDSSGSIGSANFEIARNWLISVTKSFQIGPVATQVSVIQYTSEPIPEFDLNDFKTAAEVEDGIKRMRLQNGSTRTDKALLFAAEHFHDKDFGARSQAPKVLVLISDGQDNHPERVIEAAKKLHGRDVSVFVIGIGNESQMNVKMMNEIATEPITKHIKYANTVEGINKFKNALTGQICDDVRSKQSCDSASMDLAIVFDGSDSVKADNFKKLKTWTGEFIDKLGVQEFGAQVALVKYATSIIKVSDLSSDVDELKEKLMKVPFIQGKTNTGGALERAQQVLAEGRPSVPKIILLITDGDATDKERLDAQIQKLKQSNILIYTIGVGDLIDRNELNRIATDEDFVYETRDFDSISKIKSSLLGRVCKKAKPKTSGVCGDISVDLQFIVDSSSSVTRKNFGFAKNFVANVSSVFDLRSGDVQVGVLTYSTNVHSDSAIGLGAIHSRDDFVQKVQSMKYTGGDTHTGTALKFISTNNKWREEVPKILIFVTDGTPQDRAIVPGIAKNLREKGVRIFAIGVGNAVESELKEIASEPFENHAIFIQGADYSAVQRVRGHLERLVCNDVLKITSGRDPATNLHFELARDPPVRYKQFTVKTPTATPYVPAPSSNPVYIPPRSTPAPPRRTSAPYLPPARENEPLFVPVVVNYSWQSGGNSEDSSEEIYEPVNDVRQEESNKYASYASVSSFSKFRRNGKITSGANLLKTLGFRNSNAIRGSSSGQSAWHFDASNTKSNSNSFASSLSSVFPGGLSKVFSVIFTFSLASKDFNAFQVEFNGRDYASFSFQNGDLVINREGARDIIRGDLLPELNDGNFHKIQVFFDELDVTVLVDCLQVGTLDLPTVQTAEQRSDFKLLSSGAGLVQDLAFVAGQAEIEECCELGPNALCPSRNENAAPAQSASFETARIITTSPEIKSCRDCCKIEDLSLEFLNALKEKLREI